MKAVAAGRGAAEKWLRLSEQLSPLERCTAGGLQTVQGFPRCRSVRRKRQPPPWKSLRAPRTQKSWHSRCVAPSRQWVLNLSTTCPEALHCTRSLASAEPGHKQSSGLREIGVLQLFQIRGRGHQARGLRDAVSLAKLRAELHQRHRILVELANSLKRVAAFNGSRPG